MWNPAQLRRDVGTWSLAPSMNEGVSPAVSAAFERTSMRRVVSGPQHRVVIPPHAKDSRPTPLQRL